MSDSHEILAGFLAWVVLAVGCGLVVLGWWLVAGRRREALLPPQRQRALPWNGTHILLIFFLVELFWPAAFAKILTESGFFTRLYGPQPAPTSQAENPQVEKPADARPLLWISAFAFPIQLATFFGVLQALSGARLYQLGLKRQRLGASVAAGCLGWLILNPLVFVIDLIVNQVYIVVVKHAPEEHPLTQLIFQPPTAIHWALSTFVAVVAAPILEELLFRGLLQAWTTRRPWGGAAAMTAAFVVAFVLSWPDQWTGPVLFVVCMLPGYVYIEYLAWKWLPYPNVARGIYGTALLFAVFHTNVWPTPIPLFVLALGLGYLAFRTQSLVGPIVLHALFNGLTVLALALA